MNLDLYNRKTILLAFFLLFSIGAFAETPIEKENKDLYREFVRLQNYGPADQFYIQAEKYEKFLKDHQMMEEYFKIKTNEGFFDLSQHDILRGLKTSEQLDRELHEAQATHLYYLSTGLKGDLYKATRSPLCDSIYQQALLEVGDRDPKFTMLVHMSLAQVNYMTNRSASIKWVNMAQQEAERLNNYEHRSMSLGLKCYLYFMMADKEAFQNNAEKYEMLREEFDSLEAEGLTLGKQRFSHRYDKVIEVAKAAFKGKFNDAIKMAEEELNVDRQMVIYCIHSMEGQYEKERSTEKLKWGFGIMTALYIFVYIMGRRRLIRKIWKRNDELKVALEKADAANQMKTSFIRSMSHEIRTPLNAINGFSQILCDPNFNLSEEEKEDMRKRIMSNTEAITIIINELLELAAGESVKIDESALIPVAVNKMCKNSLEASEKQNENGLRMEFMTTLDDEFTIKTNEEIVAQILGKIIDNALKFTEKGSVTIEAAQKGQMVEISVTDTGIGIPADKQDTIFDNFVKLDEFKGGVGLGLSISRRLTNLLGGNLLLDSAYTTGCRFVLQLPIR